MKKKIKKKVSMENKILKTVAWLTLFAALAATTPGCSYNNLISNLTKPRLGEVDDETKNEMDLILETIEKHFMNQGYEDLGKRKIIKYRDSDSLIKEELEKMSKENLKYMLAYRPVVIIPDGVENIYDVAGNVVDIGTGVYPDDFWYTSMLSLEELYNMLDFRGLATLTYDEGAFILIKEKVYLVYWENTLVERNPNKKNKNSRIGSDIIQDGIILLGQNNENKTLTFPAKPKKAKTMKII